jgi:T5SS/PEP-CTERM-associated repeat protein
VKNLEIALSDNTDGTLTVDGTGSTESIPTTLTVDDDATVGAGGTGSVGAMTVQAGAQATIGNDLDIGVLEGSQGTLTVTGKDATQTVSSTLGGMLFFTIGDGGSGVANVLAGGGIDAQAASMDIGAETTGTGSLTVSGEDSSVDVAAAVIGVSGDGTVLADIGGALTSTSLTIGENDGSTGSVTIQDALASWDVAVDLVIGESGDGTLTLTGADLSVGGNVIVGAEATGSDTFTINDATPDLGGDMIIGLKGNGLVQVQVGSSVTVKSLVLGAEADATGELDVDASTVQSDDLTVGDSGQGTIKLTDGATLTTVGDATVGHKPGTDVSTVTVETGSQWLLNGDLTVSEAAPAELDIDTAGQVGDLGNVNIAAAPRRWPLAAPPAARRYRTAAPSMTSAPPAAPRCRRAASRWYSRAPSIPRSSTAALRTLWRAARR